MPAFCRRAAPPLQNALFRQLHAVPFFDAPLLEESLVDLQGVSNRFGRDVVGWLVVQRLHVQDVYDPSLRVYVGDGERYPGVLHPVRELPLLRVDEEHTPVLSELFPVHETPRLLEEVVGYLDPDLDLVSSRSMDGQGLEPRRSRGRVLLCGGRSGSLQGFL